MADERRSCGGSSAKLVYCRVLMALLCLKWATHRSVEHFFFVGDIWNLLFLWYLSRLQAASWCQAQLLPSLLLLVV